MILIDGARGEGGGQILRSSVSLSALTRTPVRIVNIRGKRRKPGLSNQHVTAVESAAALCSAKLRGCSKGSLELEFIPSEIQGGSYRFDIGTAGNVFLVLQTLLPMMLRTGAELELVGGTDVQFSPSADFFRHVFLAHLKRMGVEPKFELLRRGHFPRGGGKVRLKIGACNPKPEPILSRGEFRGLKGKVHVCNLDKRIGDRILRSAEQEFLAKLKESPLLPNFCRDDISMELEHCTRSTGCGITVWAEFENTVLGYGLPGEKGLSSENLGRKVASKLSRELLSDATVDEWSSDQLILYYLCNDLFSPGRRKISKGISGYPFRVREVCSHFSTNIEVLENFGLRMDKGSLPD